MRILRPLVILVIMLGPAFAAPDKIRYKDIEGRWIFIGNDIAALQPVPADACNVGGAGWEQVEAGHLHITGRKITGYEYSCDIVKGRISGASTIVVNANCYDAGVEIKTLTKYSFTFQQGILIADESTRQSSGHFSSLRRLYVRENCNITPSAEPAKERCPSGIPIYRSDTYKDGGRVELENYSEGEHHGPITLRELDALGKTVWTHDANFTCSNGVPLCWFMPTIGEGSRKFGKNTSSSYEIIYVNPRADDKNLATIIVIAGIPLAFNYSINQNLLDIKFTDPTRSESSDRIDVPEVYYFDRCN